MALEDLDKIKQGIPYQSPVDPAELGDNDEFRFDCHPGVACFNACCRDIDITVLPYDILRLKNRLGISSSKWVNSYTIPFSMDQHELPGLKLATQEGSKACIFLSEEGCQVYEDRPSACRYYALGSMGIRREGKSHVEDVYFRVKEDHCKGHDEPKKQTVGEYRKSQSLEKYDEMNREWRDIILKKRSSGPTVGAPSARSLQLFDMCSYDIDSFENFVKSDGFKKLFKLDEQTRNKIEKNQEALLLFAARFLKQVLFGEMTIKMNEQAIDERVQSRKERIAEREQEVIDEKMHKLDNDFDAK